VANTAARPGRLGPGRLELANTQYLGWALPNRAALLPTREQLARAREVAAEARRRLRGRMEVLFVTPDYYTDLPKACMDGWGRRFIVLSPDGLALPCHAAHTLPGLHFESVPPRAPAARPRLEGRRGARVRGHLARLGGVRGLPRRELDARALPELRAARHRLRRLPLPGLPPHGRRRGHRSHLSSLPRPSPDRDGAPPGCRRVARIASLPKPARGRRGATLVLTSTTPRRFCPPRGGRGGPRPPAHPAPPIVTDPHRGGFSCGA